MNALFEAYPPEIAQHVIDAMTPRIEAEIKRVHEAVEAAKAHALKQALMKFTASQAANDQPPPVDPTPPASPKPGKRRSAWDGTTAAQRSAILKNRWVVRRANEAALKAVMTSASSPSTTPPHAHPAQTGRPIRYGSVCSGVEGLSLAWEPLGGCEPVFFSETEPFPSAVLAERWPEVPNLGDFTQIRGKEWRGKLDVLWASLPCQSFSQAGKRKGAEDQRGAMFRPFLKLADEIGAPVVILENVVGLRSDPAFGAIVEGLSGSPVEGQLSRDGKHEGPLRRLAWAVLDSGTEQRRRRIFLVACSQSCGVDPGSLLPQPESFATHRQKAHQPADETSQGSVVWLNADTTPKFSATCVGTLRASGGSAGRSLVCVNGRVRDLMPQERERLMGWDGNHTDIAFRGTEKTIDRLRNQAVGNSLALPPVRAIGERVKAAFAPATVVSIPSRPIDLRLGDCLEQMATLPDGSIDLIAADLPYQATACAWDQRLDLDLLWKEFRRVLKPNGTVLLNSAGRFTADLITSNPGWFKYALVWEKTRKSQFLHAKYRPLVAHEDVLVFSPAGACERARNKMTFNPQGVVDLAIPNVIKAGSAPSSVYKPITSLKAMHAQTKTNFPGSILSFPSAGANQHPTQKPVA